MEVEGIGFATNDALNRKGYSYMYVWRTRGEAVPRMSKWSGWKTQPDSKKLMVSLGRHLLIHDELVIHSTVLWNEMRTFSIKATQTGEGYGSIPGTHDDCVIGYLIALVISDDESFGTARTLPIRSTDKIVYHDPALTDEDDARPVDPFDRLVQEVKGWR